jgi:23S rRNA pseudouridine2605 synthase
MGYKKDAGSQDGKEDKKHFNKPDKSKKSGRSGSFEKTDKPYNKDRNPKPYSSSNRSAKPFRKFEDKEKRVNEGDRAGEFKKPFDKTKRSFRNPDEKRTSENRKPGEFKKPFDSSEKRFTRSSEKGLNGKKTGEFRKPFNKQEKTAGRSDDRAANSENKSRAFKRPFDGKRPTFVRPAKEDPFDKPFPLGTRKVSGPFRKKFTDEKDHKSEDNKHKNIKRVEEDRDKEMTLNKYIAHSGECSRRDAAALVKQGKVKVNGALMLDPGYRVKPEDQVVIAGKKLKPVRDLVYILLNKPKDFITTTDDPQGRKTVMDLVANAEIPRLYPVGRLDRETTGLLLLTNDGDLAQKLSHPSHEIKKVYQVTLSKPLTKADFEKILAGMELEDGSVKVDALSYLENKNELGIEIHSGRNRVVRRIFESLGYEVEKLDRVMYAGLTKKNLPRSKWRFLDEREVILLKHFKN